MARDALAVTGPTAVGKTELALRIAERTGAEIVSIDSRQVYRGLDIGTAKPTPAERARVPHHGIDVVDPGTRYSAGRFARDARRWVGEIRSRGRVPLLVGGTGFFLRALLEPLFEEPPLDPDRRRRLERVLARMEGERRFRWLDALDPESAAQLRRGGGRQRELRTLEVALLTGHSLGWWHRERPAREPGLDALIFVLDRPRQALDRRIDARVDAMLRAGFLEEVAGLIDAGYGPDDPGMSATGYSEAIAALDGQLSVDDAADRIRRMTRRYARRQLTWFRNQLPPDARWLDGTRPMDELVEEVVEQWRNEV